MVLGTIVKVVQFGGLQHILSYVYTLYVTACIEIAVHSPIPGSSVPALVHQQLHATGKRRGYRQCYGVRSNAPHNSMCFQIFVWDLLCEEFPQNHAVGPYVHAFRTWFMSYHFWSHPGNCASEAHYGTDVIPLATCAKVAYFHHEIISNQDTETNRLL